MATSKAAVVFWFGLLFTLTGDLVFAEQAIHQLKNDAAILPGTAALYSASESGRTTTEPLALEFSISDGGDYANVYEYSQNISFNLSYNYSDGAHAGNLAVDSYKGWLSIQRSGSNSYYASGPGISLAVSGSGDTYYVQGSIESNGVQQQISDLISGIGNNTAYIRHNGGDSSSEISVYNTWARGSIYPDRFFKLEAACDIALALVIRYDTHR